MFQRVRDALAVYNEFGEIVGYTPLYYFICIALTAALVSGVVCYFVEVYRFAKKYNLL